MLQLLARIETDLGERATDLSIYVRFLAAFVILLGVVQTYQAYRDARYLKLLVAGGITIAAVLVIIEPARLLDRV